MPKKFIITCLVLASAFFTMNAKVAQPGLHMIYQPDGTSFMATLTGDEFCHIMTTVQGNAVVQGDDGFYSYAFFETDGSIRNSGVHIGSMNVPSEVRSASLAIPYEQMLFNATLLRERVPAEEMNLMQRLNARYHGGSVVTKAATKTATMKHGIVILVNFADKTMSHSKQEFENMLNQTGYSVNGATGCAKEYFNAQFEGAYDFDFEVVGPVTVSRECSYYGGNDATGNDKAPEEMIVEACKLADAEVDFSLFDDDKDGEIDNVFVFFAGGDEAEYAGDDCIWSHAWYIKDGAGKTVYVDGVLVNRYACTSELMTLDGGKNYHMAPIGTFCHEYSHTFGLPDFYDTDYDKSGGRSDALWGSTSLMDSGCYNNNSNTPPYYNALEREILGIAEPEDLPSGSVSLKAIHESNRCFRIEGDVKNEYYIIECRQNTGWDSYIGGKGLLVYHVDKSNNSAGKSATYSRNVSAAFRWSTNEVNANPSHQCADLVEATPSASRVSQVFFPSGTYNSLTPDGKTPIQFWSGNIADYSITGITYSNGTCTFKVAGTGQVETPADVVNVSSDVFQDAAVISFEADREFNGKAYIRWGESGKTTKDVLIEAYDGLQYAAVLEGLSPKTSYKATIWFETESLAGKEVNVSFMTASTSDSGYPYIYLKTVERKSDGTFNTSAKLPLRIYNAGKNVDGILWYYGSTPIKVGKSGYWTATKSGFLKAEIIRSDGTKNIVGKQIIIK